MFYLFYISDMARKQQQQQQQQQQAFALHKYEEFDLLLCATFECYLVYATPANIIRIFEIKMSNK